MTGRAKRELGTMQQHRGKGVGATTVETGGDWSPTF